MCHALLSATSKAAHSFNAVIGLDYRESEPLGNVSLGSALECFC
jgi:hypothetical protein